MFVIAKLVRRYAFQNDFSLLYTFLDAIAGYRYGAKLIHIVLRYAIILAVDLNWQKQLDVFAMLGRELHVKHMLAMAYEL